jgi:hypothetical protein
VHFLRCPQARLPPTDVVTTSKVDCKQSEVEGTTFVRVRVFSFVVEWPIIFQIWAPKGLGVGKIAWVGALYRILPQKEEKREK